MKRTLALILAVLIMVAGLSACGKPKKPITVEDIKPVTFADDAQHVSYGTWNGSDEVPQLDSIKIMLNKANGKEPTEAEVKEARDAVEDMMKKDGYLTLDVAFKTYLDKKPKS